METKDTVTSEIDQEQLRRLLAEEYQGIEPVSEATLQALSEQIQGYNRFDPATLRTIREAFHCYFNGEERYLFGLEGSHVLYVATPWTLNQMLLDDDDKWNAAKAMQSHRFWRTLNRLEADVDEIDWRKGNEWRYGRAVPGVFANWSAAYTPEQGQDVFEGDRIVFRFWWD